MDEHNHSAPRRQVYPTPRSRPSDSGKQQHTTTRDGAGALAQRMGIELQHILNVPSVRPPTLSTNTGAGAGLGIGIRNPLSSPQQQRNYNAATARPPGPANIMGQAQASGTNNYPRNEQGGSNSQSQPMRSQMNQQYQPRRGPGPEPNSQPFNYPRRPEGGIRVPRYTNNSRYFVDNSNSNLTPAQRKVKDIISRILREYNCPDYIRKETNKILEAAYDELKASYYVSYLDPVVLQILKMHTIEIMKKRHPKFPRAKYFCNACYYHMDNIQSILSHILSSRHGESLKVRNMGEMIQFIPQPSPGHVDSITGLLLSLQNKIGLDEKDIETRFKVAKLVDNFISTQILDYPANLTLIGSSVPGFGFKWSDINLNLDFTNIPDSSSLVFKLAMGLKRRADFFGDVQIQTHQVVFTELKTKLTVRIHFNNRGAEKTAELFDKFNKIDSRVRPLVLAFRYVATLLEIDKADDGYWPPHCFTIMVLKHLQDVGVLPKIERIEFDAAHDYEYGCLTDQQLSEWKVQNNENLGKLWFTLLRKWSIEFPYETNVIALLSAQINKKSDSNLWNRKISIQDPTHLSSNLCRSAFHGRINDYFINRLRHLFHYYGIPRLTNGKPLYEGIITEYDVPNIDKINYFDIILEDGVSGRVRSVDLPNEFGEVGPYVMRQDVDLFSKMKEPSKFTFRFDKDVMDPQQKKPTYCKTCGAEGHTKRNCATERVPQVTKMPRPSEFTMSCIDSLIESIFRDEAIDENDVNIRIRITQDIDNALRPAFPELQLKLFGSTFNGFGLHNSDIDIAMRVDGRSFHKGDIPAEEVTHMLDTVHHLLSATGQFEDLRCIATAKVPIVKFRHIHTFLEGDISLSNDLALRNTELLNCYTVIDPRLRLLGCFLKKLTKICGISDASKGSLSSYAYVVLLIHYFQRTDPPVLPVLQELPMGIRPKDIVDGWDAYFWNSTGQVHLVWPGLAKNITRLSELFLGFLDYYTCEFNFKNFVVTIRQSEPLTRVEKMWISDALICIEDPFDLGHNLGQGLTNRMGCHIIKTLQKFREAFHIPLDNMPRELNSKASKWDIILQEIMLDPQRLVVSEIPIDRQCRVCLRIGHTAKNCDERDKEPENDHVARVNGKTLTPPITTHDSPEPVNSNALYTIPGLNQREQQLTPGPLVPVQHDIPHREKLWDENSSWDLDGTLERDYQKWVDSPGLTEPKVSPPWDSNSAGEGQSPAAIIGSRRIFNTSSQNSQSHIDPTDSLANSFDSLLKRGLGQSESIDYLEQYRREQNEEYCRRMLNAPPPLIPDYGYLESHLAALTPELYLNKSSKPSKTWASVANTGKPESGLPPHYNP